MKKLLCALLSAAMLLPLASCGGKNETPEPSDTTVPAVADTEEVTEPEETTEAKIEPDLPDTNWEGRTFFVLGQDNPTYDQFDNFEIWVEVMNGETLNDAIFERNSAIEEKYNVTIAQELFEHPADILKSLVNANEDTYSLIFQETQDLSASGRNGYMYDLYKVNYIDFDKPWWNPDVNEVVSLGGKLFYTSSDFSLRDKNRTYILNYNTNLAKDHDLPDIVELARSGKWTIDKMTEMLDVVSADVDGNGIYDDNDRYGLVMDSYNAFPAFLYGCDNLMLGKDENDYLTLRMNNEHMINSIDRVLALTGNPETAVFCNDYKGRVSYDHWDVSSMIFKAGRSLFTCSFPHSLAGYSAECEFDYTVIPYPKYDEDQDKYYTMAEGRCMLFGIPSCCQTPEFSGFMLEALSAASTDTTLHAYYDVVCKTKYTWNAASAEMLDVIFDGIIFDNAVLFKSSLGLYNIVGTNIPTAKTNNFASIYKKSESGSKKFIDGINEAVAKLEQ